MPFITSSFMTIDAKDYDPRPADDAIAQVKSAGLAFWDDYPRFNSFLRGMVLRVTSNDCHQLGCNFSELHG